MNITIDDFAKIEARLGKVVQAEAVEGSDKLIRFELDFGEAECRVILSGIKKWYPEPEKLVGKMMLFCTNLEPRKMMGQESHGMLMAVDGLDGQPVFLIPDQVVAPGAKIH